jgi:hypothetical protein
MFFALPFLSFYTSCLSFYYPFHVILCLLACHYTPLCLSFYTSLSVILHLPLMFCSNPLPISLLPLACHFYTPFFSFFLSVFPTPTWLPFFAANCFKHLPVFLLPHSCFLCYRPFLYDLVRSKNIRQSFSYDLIRSKMPVTVPKYFRKEIF